ncbi:MAG TPA: hypothetical protein VK149_12650 [Sideroxyarcus sp.]|nr:hypothetical protein [Sideroxyarcus sp.]
MDSHLGNFLGKVVLFSVSPQFLVEARSIFQLHGSNPLLYGKLLAIDSIGCWVENKTWKASDAKSDEPISFAVNLLIPWAYIVSVAAFPDDSFADIPEGEMEKSIGFLAQRN